MKKHTRTLLNWKVNIVLIIFIGTLFAFDTPPLTNNVPVNTTLKSLDNSIESSLYYQNSERKKISNNEGKQFERTLTLCNQSIESSNRVINFVGWIATIFGIIIALAGLFIALESIRSRKRKQEAFESLEKAQQCVDSYIEEIKEKSAEIDVVMDIAKNHLMELAKDTDRPAQKDIEMKGIQDSEVSKKKLKELEEKINLFEAINLPDDPTILFSKALLLKGRKKYLEAINLLKKIVKIDRNSAEAFLEIGEISFILKEYKNSVEYFELCLELEEHNIRAQHFLGQSLIQLERYEDALVHIAKAIDKYPTNPGFYSIKTTCLAYLEKYSELNETMGEIEMKFKFEYPTLMATARALFSKNKPALTKRVNEFTLRKYEMRYDKFNRIGDLLNSLELIIILKDYEKAAEIVNSTNRTILSQTVGYQLIFFFLSVCLYFLKREPTVVAVNIKNIEDIYSGIDDGEEVRWNFNDINPFLEKSLEATHFKKCMTIENLLEGKITIEQFREYQ